MKRVLVCGDAMSDIYYRGDCARISPEAPVPIVSVKSAETRPGGAANVAANVEAMGATVERIFGASPQRIQKIRLLARDHHIARIDFDYPQTPIEPDAAYLEAVARCDTVVFIDYGKGSLANISALLGYAHNLGRRTLIDPKGHDYARYRGATLIKPNKDEMRELVGGWDNQEQLDFKARQFLLQSGIESILLTQGDSGMTLYTRTETHHEPAGNIQPVDVSGAGEATIAAYAVALAKGHKAAECVKYASKAAALSCGMFGTVVCSEGEVFGTG